MSRTALAAASPAGASLSGLVLAAFALPAASGPLVPLESLADQSGAEGV